VEKHEIIITMEGGVIQSIDNIPKNIKVKLIDFDVEGVEVFKLDIVNGNPAVVSYWEKE